MKLFRSSQSKGNVFFIPYSVYVEGSFFFFFLFWKEAFYWGSQRHFLTFADLSRILKKKDR